MEGLRLRFKSSSASNSCSASRCRCALTPAASAKGLRAKTQGPQAFKQLARFRFTSSTYASLLPMGLLGWLCDGESASDGLCGAAPATNISSTEFCFLPPPPAGRTLAGTAFKRRGPLFSLRCVFRIVLRICTGSACGASLEGSSPEALVRATGCVEGLPRRSARFCRGHRTTSPEVAQRAHALQ